MKSERRVVVTGGTGFVGKACTAELLKLGFSVFSISRGKKPGRRKIAPAKGEPDRRGAKKPERRIEQITLDIFDKPAVEACFKQLEATDLVHCAWDVTPGTYWNSPDNFNWVEPTLNLVRAFSAAGGTRVVGIGSCAEYEWSAPTLSEKSSPCVPASAYGQAKHLVSNGLNKIAAESGLALAWARLFYLFGPGEARGRLVSEAINSLVAAQPFVCRTPEAERDLLFIEDAGRAIAELASSELTGAINIASGRTVSIRSVVDSIAAHLHREDLIKFDPSPGASDVGESDLGESDRFCADIKRLKEELRFTPGYSLRQGLERSVEWWQTRVPGPMKK